MTAPQSIDDYIAQYPPEVQAILQKTRATIAKVAKGATEKMAYGIPTFHLKENLVHFGAAKKHLGFYPTSQPIIVFAEELKPYKTSRGAIQFPLDEKIPYALITKITKYRMQVVQGK